MIRNSVKKPRPRWTKPGWLFLGTLAIVAIGWNVFWYTRSVPNSKVSKKGFEAYKPPACRTVAEADGMKYNCPFNGVRLYVPLKEISPRLQKLVVQMEDAKFYMHNGLDVDEIVNSINKNIERGKFARGASTITQQLAKNLFLSKEKSILRKASEVPLTMRLEKELTKNQILELYLNTIEWGYGVYGIEAASRLYFDTSAEDLTEEQAWLLTVMIPNPKELLIWVKPRAKKSILGRARHMADRLWQEKRMEKEDADAAYDKFAAFVDSWEIPPVDTSRRKFPFLPVPPARKIR